MPTTSPKCGVFTLFSIVNIQPQVSAGWRGIQHSNRVKLVSEMANRHIYLNSSRLLTICSSIGLQGKSTPGAPVFIVSTLLNEHSSFVKLASAS